MLYSRMVVGIMNGFAGDDRETVFKPFSHRKYLLTDIRCFILAAFRVLMSIHYSK